MDSAYEATKVLTKQLLERILNHWKVAKILKELKEDGAVSVDFERIDELSA